MIPLLFAEGSMRRLVEGLDRGQAALFPECLEDWIDEDNPVRVIDAFVEKLDLSRLGFDGVVAEATGRPSYHPSVLLKLYIYGYLKRVQSSRWLEGEAGRNVEVSTAARERRCGFRDGSGASDSRCPARVCRRHQPHGVAKCLQLARPMV
jgi:hypothetical protein